MATKREKAEQEAAEKAQEVRSEPYEVDDATMAPPAQPLAAVPDACVMCGGKAEYQTTTPGASPLFYCHEHHSTATEGVAPVMPKQNQTIKDDKGHLVAKLDKPVADGSDPRTDGTVGEVATDTPIARAPGSPV